MQTETVGSCLKRLRELNKDVVRLYRCLDSIEDINEMDGLQAYINRLGIPGTGSKASKVEMLVIRKQDLGIEGGREGIEDELGWYKNQMVEVLEGIRYRVRSKEFDILWSYYIDRARTDLMENLFGKRWLLLFEKIYTEYGVR